MVPFISNLPPCDRKDAQQGVCLLGILIFSRFKTKDTWNKVKWNLYPKTCHTSKQQQTHIPRKENVSEGVHPSHQQTKSALRERNPPEDMDIVIAVFLMPPEWLMAWYIVTLFFLESWRNEISTYKLSKIQVSGSHITLTPTRKGPYLEAPDWPLCCSGSVASNPEIVLP